MSSLLHRKKKLLLGVAAGAAGAAAAYYLWSSYSSAQQEQQEVSQQSIQFQLAELLGGRLSPPPVSGTSQHSGTHPDGGADSGGDSDPSDCAPCDVTIDEALDRQLQYIQDVSTPQELEQLLPRVRALLYEATDVGLVRSALGPDGQPLAADAKLRMLAQLCYARSAAACFLVPLLDLYVRTKLNIIGRHLFLQEKLERLAPPSTLAASAAAPQGMGMGAAASVLPPRLTPAAVETFLQCDQFAEVGCRWLVHKALAAAEDALHGVALDTPASARQLAALLQRCLDTFISLLGPIGPTLAQPVTATYSIGPMAQQPAASSSSGSGWVDVLVPPEPTMTSDMARAMTGSADAYRRACASAAMAAELSDELRGTLCSPRFAAALNQGVTLCFGMVAGQLQSSFMTEMAQAQAPSSRSPSPVSTGHCNVALASQIGQDAAAGASAGIAPSSSGQHLNAADGGASSSGSGQALLSSQTHAAAAMASSSTRPLARSLKLIHSACEPLYSATREVTAAIAQLPRVCALCATTFAAPPLL